MEKGAELEKLRREIQVLRDTVSSLTRTIDDLKTTVIKDTATEKNLDTRSDYRIFQD